MQIIDIIGSNWKLTLPTGSGKPTEIEMPTLASYDDDHFYLTTGDGVVFVAPTTGVSTDNSRYKRSELREMTADGTVKAAWASTSGVHSMEVELTIDEVPIGSKPHVVVAQIHKGSGDVCVFRFEGSTIDRTVGKLWITDGDTSHGHFVTDVRLGQRIQVGFHAQDGVIRFMFNSGTIAYEQEKKFTGGYFKTGCYLQTNEVLPDGEDFAQVTIYKLAVTHSDAAKPVDPPTCCVDELAQLRADLAALAASHGLLSFDVNRRFAALKAAL
jgi:hypothetical protein